MNLLLVMTGGAIGAGARYLTGRVMFGAFGPAYPWGTLTVNILGGMLMGLLVGTLARSAVAGEPWRLLLGVGVLGGFTTFSAFSLDAVSLYERGAAAAALGYVLGSVVLSILALGIGLAAVRSLA